MEYDLMGFIVKFTGWAVAGVLVYSELHDGLHSPPKRANDGCSPSSTWTWTCPIAATITWSRCAKRVTCAPSPASTCASYT